MGCETGGGRATRSECSTRMSRSKHSCSYQGAALPSAGRQQRLAHGEARGRRGSGATTQGMPSDRHNRTGKRCRVQLSESSPRQTGYASVQAQGESIRGGRRKLQCAKVRARRLPACSARRREWRDYARSIRLAFACPRIIVPRANEGVGRKYAYGSSPNTRTFAALPCAGTQMGRGPPQLCETDNTLYRQALIQFAGRIATVLDPHSISHAASGASCRAARRTSICLGRAMHRSRQLSTH